MRSWLTEIRGKVPWAWAIPLGLLPILALLGLWYLRTSGPDPISPTILPSPGRVFSGEMLSRLFEDRDIFHHTWLSLRRTGLGYLVAVAIVLPLGVGMGAFGSIRAIFSPLVTASGYTPIVTLVPLTMAWCGTGETQKIVFLAIAFSVYLLPLVARAIDNVPDTYLRTSYTLGAGRAQAVFRVLVPIALPEIWHSMRLCFGVGWTYLVLTEMVVQEGGLGDLIIFSNRRAELRPHVYLIILLITVIAWIADQVWVRTGHLLFPYRRARS